MTSSIAIKAGILLADSNDNSYRVLNIINKNVTLIQVTENKKNIKKRLVFSSMSLTELRTAIEKQTLTILEERIIDFSTDDLSEEEKKTFEKYRSFVTGVVRLYGPSFMRLLTKESKPEIDRLIEQVGLSREGARIVLARYLQSGCKEVSLLPNYRKLNSSKSKPVYTKKTGRPARTKYDLDGNQLPTLGKILTETDYKIFDKYCRKYLNGETSSITSVYNDMITEAYSVEVETEDGFIRQELPADQKPSEWQFYCYLRNNITPEQKAIAKKKASEVRNNQRVFTGSVMTGVKGPGDMVEIDAHEVNVSMVSQEFPEICIGRPIIYLMIDVFTRIILAISVALDNNSLVGLTNCFFNLVEDKEELYKKYGGTSFKFKEGFSIEDLWPTNYKPAHLRYDHGSDFISDDIVRIMNELNIIGDMVPPATGSMKPIVERIFGDIEMNLKDLLEHKGLIRKVYGSKHHQEACLDINDATKTIMDYVIFHNTDALRQYKRSAGMKKNGVLPIPCMLWKYGIEHMINPEIIVDRDAFIFKIMSPLPGKKATISRQGIEYRDLKYFNEKDLHDIMFRLQDSKEEFQCRIDPRDCGHIFYLHNGLKAAFLDQRDPIMRSYIGMSWKHYDEISKNDVIIADTMEIHHGQNQRQFRERVKATVDAAYSSKEGPADTKNMRQNRLEEKEKVAGALSVSNRFEIKPEKQLSDNQEDNIPAVKTDIEQAPQVLIPRDIKEVEKRMKEKARKRLMMDEEDE